MEDRQLRREFRAFLERLNAGSLDKADWQKYAVNHYSDDLVEDVRRESVRIMIAHSPKGEAIPLTHDVQERLARLSCRLEEEPT